MGTKPIISFKPQVHQTCLKPEFLKKIIKERTGHRLLEAIRKGKSEPTEGCVGCLVFRKENFTSPSNGAIAEFTTPFKCTPEHSSVP